MKRVLLLLIFLLILPVASALDTFPVSFHSSGLNESISLDIAKYLKHSGPFKHTPVEHVNIFFDGGIAIITSKDPAWQGIEDIIFAPIGVELRVPEPVNRTERVSKWRNITISKTEIDSALGSEIDRSFYVLAGDLEGEKINISGFLSDDSLSLNINDEVSLNLSLNGDKGLSPEFLIDVHDLRSDLTLADYSEPFNWLFLIIVVFLIFSCVVTAAYIYTGYAQNVFRVMVDQEKKEDKKVMSSAFKRKAKQNLLGVKSGLSEGNSKDVLKKAEGILDEFFSGYAGIAAKDKDELFKKLERKKVSRAIQKEIKVLYDDYASMMYGDKKISKQTVSVFVRKAHDTIRKL
ncbi:MAG: hypothetical protein V1914_01215 [archaeon]